MSDATVTRTDVDRARVEGADAAATDGPRRWVTSRSLERCIGAGLLAAAVILPLLRQRGVHTWETMWAEDGQLYVDDITRTGTLSTVFRGYAGYLQLSSRLLALPAAVLPARSLALYLVGSAAVVTALLAWFVYYASRSWVASRPVRIALASLVVLQPALGYENIGSITNTIWAFAIVLPWALVGPTERRRDVALCGGVAFTAVASTALGLFFFPVALVAALHRRTAAAWTVFGAYGAGCALQLGVMTHTHDQDRGAIVNSARELGNLIGAKVFGVFLLGPKVAASLWIDLGRTLSVGAAIVVVALLVLCLRGVDREAKVLAVLFAGSAIVLYSAPLWARGTAGAHLVTGAWTDDGSRYSVIPVMLLTSAFAVLVAPVGRGYGRPVARWGRVVLIAQIVVVTVMGFSVTNMRSNGPVWDESVTTVAATQCRDASPDALVAVPITPPPWAVTLRCSQLTG